MVTCRVLPRFTLETNANLPAPGSSLVTQRKVNFFRFTFLRTLLHGRFRQLLYIHAVPHSLVRTPGGSVHPSSSDSSFQCLTHSSTHSLPQRFVASLRPLQSRWSPVVFPREMLSISYPLISLPDCFFHNEGVYTPSSQFGVSQTQGVGNHGNRTEAHGRAGDHGTQQPAEDMIEHPGSNRYSQ